MRFLSERLDAEFISYDNAFVRNEDRALVNALKSEFLSRLKTSTSRQLLISLLHAILMYIRDRIPDTGARPVLLDGYYYKVLGKCLLHNVVDWRIFSMWRSFPRPSGIIFLDAAPDVAWQRCNNGQTLNPFEHYALEPTLDSFCTFQRDLRATMLEEVSGIPLEIIDANRPREETAGRVHDAILTRLKQ